MRRRDLIAILGGTATLGWPRCPAAQQATMPVIGYIVARPQSAMGGLNAAFRAGLDEDGRTEGRNVAIDFRYIEGRYDALTRIAAELVARRVALIVTEGGSQPARVAMAATSTIPILFVTGSDPVADGLVASFNRPQGNVTGVSMMVGLIDGKRLQLLHELVPSAAVIALLVNPSFENTEHDVSNFEAAARALNLQLIILRASSADEINTAFTSLDQRKPDALIVSAEPFFNGRAQQIVALAARRGIPAVYGVREYAAAGGLMSYGSNFEEAYRQAGRYAGKILDGARPADLPVVQSSTFQLVINLATAKAIGLTIPPTLLARADEVIE